MTQPIFILLFLSLSLAQAILFLMSPENAGMRQKMTIPPHRGSELEYDGLTFILQIVMFM